MSTMTCATELDTRSKLDTSVFDFNDFNDHFDPVLGALPSSDYVNAPESTFSYDFLDFDHDTTTFPALDPGHVQAASVDPTLVLPLSFPFIDPTPSTYPPASLLNPTIAPSIPNTNTEYTSTSINTTQITHSPTSPPVSPEQPTDPPKRRSRKRKNPLTTPAKEERRRVFLEKNRKAAQKCRERNKRKWDRLQEQCLQLEARNRVLREDWAGLKGEVAFLREWIGKHAVCGDEEVRRVMEEKQDSSSSFPSSTKGRGGPSIKHDVGDANPREPLLDLDLDLDLEIRSRIDDADEVPSLSSSRKTSASLTDFELEDTHTSTPASAPAPKILSPIDPTDPTIALLLAANSAFGEVEFLKQEQEVPLTESPLALAS